MNNVKKVQNILACGELPAIKILRDAIEDMLTIQHSLTIVDLMYKLNNKQYSESLRRKIQSALQGDDRFDRLIEKMNVDMKFAGYGWCLTKHMNEYGLLPLNPTEYRRPTYVMTGASKLCHKAMAMLTIEIQSTGYTLASTYDVLVSKPEKSVVKQLLLTMQKRCAKDVVDMQLEYGLTDKEFESRMRQNASSYLKTALRTSNEFKRKVMICS